MIVDEAGASSVGQATDRLEVLIHRLVAPDAAADHLAEQLSAIEHPDAAAWEGIARLRAGDRDGAARRLRAWTRAEGAARSDRLAWLVDAALVLAEGDAAALARHLLERHGPRWPDFSPMVPDQLVEQVSCAQPPLLVDLLVDVTGVPASPAARLAALRAVVELAENSAHCGLAMGCLYVAQRLISEVG